MRKRTYGRGVFEGDSSLTRHAEIRMQQRSIPASGVDSALNFGRIIHARGAEIFALGGKEVRAAAALGHRLEGYEGIQVVCTGSGTILTIYRNCNFRGLRPRRRRCR